MKEHQKKYELTDEFIEHWSGKKLYRIRALVYIWYRWGWVAWWVC